MGVALKRAFAFIASSFKSCRKHSNRMIESEVDSEIAAAMDSEIAPGEGECPIEKIQECVESTDALKNKLFAIEQAQEEQYQCLRQKGHSVRAAREIQWAQRPEGHGHIFSSNFLSVDRACYRVRANLECMEQFRACRDAAYEAEALERAQRNACS